MVALTDASLHIRTYQQGDTIAGIPAGSDGWTPFSMPREKLQESLKELVQQKVFDPEGQRHARLKISDNQVIQTLREVGSELGVRVERVVKLGSTKSTQAAETESAAASSLIYKQLIQIEQDLRQGRRVKVELNSVDVAYLAGKSLNKLLRISAYKKGDESLLRVFVNGSDLSHKRQIIQAMGPSLILKHDLNHFSFRKVLNSCLNKFASWFLKPHNIPAKPFLNKIKTPLEQELYNTRIARDARRQEVMDKLTDRLEAKAENDKPVTLTINSVEDFRMVYEKLEELDKKYGKLLVVNFSEKVESYRAKYLAEKESIAQNIKAQKDKLIANARINRIRIEESAAEAEARFYKDLKVRFFGVAQREQ